jgi:hypothetical protein
MKPLTAVGLLLIVLALIGYATGGLSFTHRHTDVATGSIQISHEQRSTVPLSPYLSTVALVAGIGMIAFAGRTR